jgi:hypothetical protein
MGHVGDLGLRQEDEEFQVSLEYIVRSSQEKQTYREEQCHANFIPDFCFQV